ncbi:flippase-like domain-containing protein [Roseburia sp. BX0805]|uniref:Phosphatidylglycerol lysyltransferase n=1 Tax=Roseburia yibonii TaxID=2763063 RepID=A0ABR7I7I6_9FIRM|nr:lysylphosphatidylglycerol synthase transmembrane domain-containing protein [Roseburia yibonii]MBC5752833.1 flippase-like domain-containing protein [Roseburia yibonii]
MLRRILAVLLDLSVSVLILLAVWIFSYKLPQSGIRAETQVAEIGAGVQIFERTQIRRDTTDWHAKFADKFTDTVVATDTSYTSPDLSGVLRAVGEMRKADLAVAVVLAVGYVSAEGWMIWYLLKGMCGTSLWRCISCSFIGFFFSGITPSATGGQPVQLYDMKKDGIALSASSVVLMTVALFYKVVLVLLGAGIGLFWRMSLKDYMKGYYGLYFFGLLCNAAFVLLLLFVMFSPEKIRAFIYRMDDLFTRIGIWKKSDRRKKKTDAFLDGYRETVCFFKSHRKVIAVIFAVTCLQRLLSCVGTYAVYRGLRLCGTGVMDIALLQAAVYITVEILPLPGAQGISEAVYHTAFSGIFPGTSLLVSMCVTRGISFYLNLLIGLIVFGVRMMGGKNKK